MMIVRVNGQNFTLWETASLSRSIDASSASFSFTSSDKSPREYPVKEGDSVEIVIDDIVKCTGFVFEVSAGGDSQSHTIRVTGRDTTADIIDSSLPDSAKAITSPLSLRTLAEKVIDSLGANISVIDDSGGADKQITDDLQAGGSGDKCMDFLMSFARKSQIYLTPDGLGGLVLYRPSADLTASPLLHLENEQRNNVKKWRVKRSQQSRFNTVVCRSQDNVGFSDDADYGEEGTARTGIAVDDEIRDARFLEVVGEESMKDSECLGRAKEEVNLRRARGVEYEATVAGHSQSNGEPWDFGFFVNVQDFYADVFGLFLIRGVTYSADSRGGSNTVIVCASPDAYKVKDIVTKQEARKAKIGRTFLRPPTEGSGFGR